MSWYDHITECDTLGMITLQNVIHMSWYDTLQNVIHMSWYDHITECDTHVLV